MRKQRFYKLLFFLAALFLIGIGIIWIKNLLVSYVIASVVYFTLAPVRDFLERRGVAKMAATLLPFFTLIALISLSIQLVLPTLSSQLDTVRANFPKYALWVDQYAANFKVYLTKFFPTDVAVQVTSSIQSGLADYGQSLFKGIPGLISSSVTVLFLAPFLAFFMLLNGREIIRTILTLVPNNIFELSLSLNHQITTQMGGFIRARLWETIIYTVFLWICFAILDFPFALLLAVLGGVLNIIPYIGPVIGAVPAFIIASSNGMEPSIYIKLFVIYSSAQAFDMIVIVPFLVARIVNLHPVSVVLAIIAGSQIMGILGMIISLPVASTIKVTLTAIYRHLTGHKTD